MLDEYEGESGIENVAKYALHASHGTTNPFVKIRLKEEWRESRRVSSNKGKGQKKQATTLSSLVTKVDIWNEVLKRVE